MPLVCLIVFLANCLRTGRDQARRGDVEVVPGVGGDSRRCMSGCLQNSSGEPALSERRRKAR